MNALGEHSEIVTENLRAAHLQTKWTDEKRIVNVTAGDSTANGSTAIGLNEDARRIAQFGIGPAGKHVAMGPKGVEGFVFGEDFETKIDCAGLVWEGDTKQETFVVAKSSLIAQREKAPGASWPTFVTGAGCGIGGRIAADESVHSPTNSEMRKDDEEEATDGSATLVGTGDQV